MGVAVSSSHVVSAAPSSPGEGLLALLPCFSMGSLPWAIVLHKLLQHGSFPRAAVLHELLQRGSPTGSQALSANLLQRGLLSPRGHRSYWEPAPVWAPHRVIAVREHNHLLQRGVLHGLQADSWPHHGLLYWLQGNLCTSFCTDLDVCRVAALMYSHTSLWLKLP